jgi:hypothetical protein
MTDRYREGIEAELLPCPFCGGPATLGGMPKGIIGEVRCRNEDCFGPKTTALTKADSIRQWNTRDLPLPSTPDDAKAVHLKTWQNLRALWLALDDGPKPRCRDCADFDGRCQGDGLPCDPQERALEQITRLRERPASDCAIREALKYARVDIDAAITSIEHYTGGTAVGLRQTLGKINAALSAHAGGAAKESGGLCPVPPGKNEPVSTETASDEGESSEFGAAARRMPDSESIGSLAHVEATTQCGNGVPPGPPATHAEVKG